MTASCGKTAPHPAHPIWINGGAHPPIQCPGVPEDKVHSTRTCPDGVIVHNQRVGCQVLAQHHVHIGFYDTTRLTWWGSVGSTVIEPAEVPLEGTGPA